MIALHAFAITRYGYFRDEMYYLACAQHLAFGYVDQPPLSIAILACVRALLGTSLVALRLVPMLANVATIVLTGAMVRALISRRLKSRRGPLDERRIASLCRSLLRAGFSSDVIRREVRATAKVSAEEFPESPQEEI